MAPGHDLELDLDAGRGGGRHSHDMFDPRRPSLLLVLPWLLTLSAGAAAQSCPEPSALDVSPSVEPLRVHRTDGGELQVTWEAVSADWYRLHRGTTTRLAEDGSYDHLPVAEPLVDEVVLPMPSGNRYFVVTAHCGDEKSSAGRSFPAGEERPSGGLAEVMVGLVGSGAVFAADITVTHPRDRTFIEPDAASFIGPFAPGQPGSPFGFASVPAPGEVAGSVTFFQFDPDPSFPPPADVLFLRFGFHGPLPTVADFQVTRCAGFDVRGDVLPGVSCDVVDLRLLP